MGTTWADRLHMSQKMVRRSSTLSGVRAATSVPSSAPAVLAAKTAATSRQSGGWPWRATLSYSPACSSSSRSESSPLIWATAAFRGTASGEGSLEKRIPKGEASRAPTSNTTARASTSTAPPTREARALTMAVTALAIPTAAFWESPAAALAACFAR